MKNELIKDIDGIYELLKDLTKSGSCGEHGGSADYEDATNLVDIILRSSICRNLLFLFWNREKNACLLSDFQRKQQEDEFNNWLLNVDFEYLIREINKTRLQG